MMNEVQHIFVYGTLRPDDDSGAEWTQAWTSGMKATRAKVHDAKLYFDTYPFVFLDKYKGETHQQDACDEHKNFVVGYLMSCETKEQFEQKLAYGDKIEGYPHEYQRDVVTAVREEDGERVACYIYHRYSGVKLSTPILTGDWQSRNKETAVIQSAFKPSWHTGE